jgi:hypothetical protein
LAIQGFRRLVEYVKSGPTGTALADLSIDHHLRSKEDTFADLHSTHLPLLKEQISSLSQAMKSPDKLRQDPGPTFELILAIQPKIVQSWDQIIHAINHIFPVQAPQPNLAIDSELEEFKFYRLSGLNRYIRTNLKTSIQRFCDNACLLIGELLQSRITRPVVMDRHSHHLDGSIDSAIVWFKGSELHLLNGYWQAAIGDIKIAWRNLLIVVDPGNSRTRRPFAELAKPFIPLLKLIKLFFDKISKLGLTKRGVRSCTGMSTDQLFLFENLAIDIAELILGSVCSLQEPRGEEPELTRQDLLQDLKELPVLFQRVVLLLDLYLVPLFPDINSLSAQKYFKSWFVTWYTLFFQATNNAIQACHLFAPTLN